MTALSATVFCSCNEKKAAKHDGEDGSKNYSIKVIDGCEYIECDYGVMQSRVYSLTHKGNCKYCAERNNNKNK